MTELGAAAPACTSILHLEHPLHHLVLDLAEQIGQTFEHWMAKAAPRSSFEVSMPSKTVSALNDLLTSRAA